MNTRKVLTMYNMHHPKADIDCVDYMWKGKEEEGACYKLKRHIKQK